MSKWTQDPTYPRIIIDEDRQAICEILGDSARQAAAFTCLIAEAPAMAECLKKCERLAWEIGCYTDDGIHVLHDDERGDLWREISGILERINK